MISPDEGCGKSLRRNVILFHIQIAFGGLSWLIVASLVYFECFTPNNTIFPIKSVLLTDLGILTCWYGLILIDWLLYLLCNGCERGGHNNAQVHRFDTCMSIFILFVICPNIASWTLFGTTMLDGDEDNIALWSIKTQLGLNWLSHMGLHFHAWCRFYENSNGITFVNPKVMLFYWYILYIFLPCVCFVAVESVFNESKYISDAITLMAIIVLLLPMGSLMCGQSVKIGMCLYDKFYPRYQRWREEARYKKFVKQYQKEVSAILRDHAISDASINIIMGYCDGFILRHVLIDYGKINTRLLSIKIYRSTSECICHNDMNWTKYQSM